MNNDVLLQKIGEMIQPIRDDIGTLKEDVKTLDMKVEVYHSETQESFIQIMNILVDSNEINGGEINTLKKRVDRLEKQ